MATKKPIAREELKTLSRRVLVTVRRDPMTNTPISVWQHEIPLLQEIHGEDEVQIVDPSVMDEGYKAKASPDLMPYNKKQDLIRKPSESVGLGYVFIGSPQVEYERLANAYGRHKDVDRLLVEHIYGRFQEGRFAEMLGAPQKTDLPAEQLLELIKAHGYLPEVTHDASKEEKVAAAKSRTDLHAKSQVELVALSDELEIAID